MRLKDVATIALDHFEVREMAYGEGERSIRMAVRREAGSNVIQIKEDLLPLVEEMQTDLMEPNGVRIVLLGDGRHQPVAVEGDGGERVLNVVFAEHR